MSWQALVKRSGHGRSVGGEAGASCSAALPTSSAAENTLTSSLRKKVSPQGEKRTDTNKADSTKKIAQNITCLQPDVCIKFSKRHRLT